MLTRLFIALIICFGTLKEVYADEPVWPDEVRCRQFIDNPINVEDVTMGWCLSIDRRKGNCVACHNFNVAPWPTSLPIAGNIAPPLVAMMPRFPDQSRLIQQIEDASAFNANTTMPPFLAHGILTKEEIALVVKFLLTI